METQKPSFKKPLKPFACIIPQCSQTFRDQGELLEHLRMHREDKRDQDDLNGNLPLKSETPLKNSKLGQHSSKPHRCEICHQSFTQVSNLRRHERVHRGERPYECEICNKKFSTSSNQKQHMLVHQEKDNRAKFRCEKCNTSYFYKASLKKHMRNHQGGNHKYQKMTRTKHPEETGVPIKKLFVTPTSNVSIPEFRNDQLVTPEKKKELVDFWQLNSNNYFKANPLFLSSLAFPTLLFVPPPQTPKNTEQSNKIEDAKKSENYDSKELSDTLSHTSKLSKEKSSPSSYKFGSLEAENTSPSHPVLNTAESSTNKATPAPLNTGFGAGIKIPIPIRPQRMN